MPNSIFFPTNNSQITSAFVATLGAAPGSTYLAQAAAMNSPAGVAQVLINATGATTAAALATIVQANLGIAATDTTATAYITSQFNTAGGVANSGQALLTLLTTFSGLASDPTYGAAVNAYNATVNSSLAYSSIAANNSTDLAALQAVVTGGQTTLTTGQDTLSTVKASGITFNAPIINNANTLQSGDTITGGAGVDTLNAQIGNSQNFAISANTSNIETMRFHVQAVAADSTTNNMAVSNQVQIDAQNMSGVTRWEDNNSRANLLVEDVRIQPAQITKNITIAMVATDPGHVDMGVYFDQYSLRSSSASTSGVLRLQLMDTRAVSNTEIPGTVTSGTPLLREPYNGFTFKLNGQLQTVTFPNTDASGVNIIKTYPDLLAAITKAVAADPVVSKLVTVSSGQAFTAYDTLLPTTPLPGTEINITTIKGGDVLTVDNTTGWTLSGQSQTTSGFHSNATTVPVNTTPNLVTSTIVLDDVGRGATGGDLVVGGLAVGDTSNSGGVQRFEITVLNNSKLQHITSTNNWLQEVNIENDNTSVDGSTSNANTTSQNNAAYGINNVSKAGTLTVNGGVLATTPDATLPGVNTVNGGNQHGAFGFTDVRLIDASLMTGDLAFTAQVTGSSIAKYINLVDTQANPAADNTSAPNSNVVPGGSTPQKAANLGGGAAADFLYTGGAGNDAMVVQLDSSTVASRSNVISGREDFSFNINGGAGSDKITVYVNNAAGSGTNNGTQNWYNNQDVNNNITVIGGDGSDTIRTPGAGDKTIYGGNVDFSGTGNDTIYTDNTGSQALAAGAVGNGAVGGSTGVANVPAGSATPPTTATNTVGNGVGTSGAGQWTNNVTAHWVFNTADQVTALSGARNVNDLRSDSDAHGNYNLYKDTLTVTFKGISSAGIVLADTASYMNTDLQINQAIKSAINNDPVLNKLLLASDGPAHSLVVTSLIDGVRSAADLGVAITTPATGVLTAAEVSAAGTAYGQLAPTEASVLAAMNASLTAFNTRGDYVTAMGNDGTQNIVGANSLAVTDNVIHPAISGQSVIVLSTTANSVAANTLAQNMALSSNETIILHGNGTNSFADTIVNFTPATTAGVSNPGVDHLDLTFGGTSGLGGSVFQAAGIYTVDKSVNVAATALGVNDSAAAVGALFSANNVAAQTHVYVSVNAAGIGSVYTVADAAGATNAVATLQGTIDLDGAGSNNVWMQLSANNFVNVAGTANYTLLEGSSGAGAAAAPAPAGGGGGGGAAATSVAVAAANAPAVADATTGNVTYTIGAITSTYTYTINGFAAGDHLAFPAGTVEAISNTNPADGNLTITGTNAGQTVTIQLTGVAAASDAGVFNLASFNATFGVGSLA